MRRTVLFICFLWRWQYYSFSVNMSTWFSRQLYVRQDRQSGSIMSWLVKMECDKNACARCLQWHQQNCPLRSDHCRENSFFMISSVFLQIPNRASCWSDSFQRLWISPCEVFKSQLVVSAGLYESPNKLF